MASLWQLTGAPIPTSDSRPTFDRPYDTIVVGAGLTGLVTAVLLARAGQRVAVFEARTVGAVATGNTTAKLSLLQGSVYSSLRTHLGDEAVREYAEGNREGQAWLVRELEHLGMPVERQRAVTFVHSESQRSALEQELEACQTAGVGAEWTTDTGLPFAVAAAIALPDQVQLQPIDVLAALAAELLARGGELHEGVRVTGANVSGTRGDDAGGPSRRVRLNTPLGVATADRCVLATGVPILDRGMFFARVEPNRSFVGAYSVPEAYVPRGMHVSIDEPSRSLRTARGASGETLVLVGGGDHTTGRGGDTRRALADLDAFAKANLHAGPRVTWWAAQDYRRHASAPYAAPLPGGHDRVFAATGYNKWGMTNAVASGLAIASQMLGGRTDWADVYRRTTPGVAGVADAARVNASVAGHVVADWAGAMLGGSEGELAEGEGSVRREGRKPVAVAQVDGRECRVSAVCTHLGGIVNWNPAERSWDCPLHGSRFAADGTILEGPATSDLAAS
ncbi:FAD-dependent oxidoreductase [Leucobacter sp. USHLN153]|uniref:FAD-dependent oxidoreductase n=1 Tax=Leucobacter sp. USHLN153 TaxID=3081268 RepID=UPI003018AE7F